MTYRNPIVERCATDAGYAPGWVVLIDRGSDDLEAFDVPTWEEGMRLALAWSRVMLAGVRLR